MNNRETSQLSVTTTVTTTLPWQHNNDRQVTRHNDVAMATQQRPSGQTPQRCCHGNTTIDQ